MSMNADPNASFSLSTWILKSPTIKILSAASTNSDRKSPNSLIKSVWCSGGLYSSQYKHHRVHHRIHTCNPKVAGSSFGTSRDCRWRE